MKKIRYISYAVIIITILFTQTANTQIKNISAQTIDKLVISVWISGVYTWGDDVRINYKVKNNGTKPIYLVRKNSVEFENSDEIITVNPFTVGFNEFGSIDYSFILIGRGKFLEGQYLIPSKHIKREGLWFIDVGFAFISNIKELQPKSPAMQDPAAFRGLIAYRSVPIKIGKLWLLINAKK